MTAVETRRIFDCDDDSDYLRNESVPGDFIRWVDDRVYKLELLPGTTAHLGFRVIFECAKCRSKGIEAFITRGAPGWCYVYDLNGNYEADLRNQEWSCDSGCEVKK